MFLWCSKFPWFYFYKMFRSPFQTSESSGDNYLTVSQWRIEDWCVISVFKRVMCFPQNLCSNLLILRKYSFLFLSCWVSKEGLCVFLHSYKNVTIYEVRIPNLLVSVYYTSLNIIHFLMIMWTITRMKMFSNSIHLCIFILCSTLFLDL